MKSRWFLAAAAGAVIATGAGGSAAQSEGLTGKAKAQVEVARRAAAPLSTPEAARAAGYVPVFGHVPLQGEHYVRMDLVRSGRFDPSRPPVLMFAPVGGRERLVGAAFAYLHPTRAGMPEGFDGDADPWHSHDDLTHVPGKHLVMTHLWFTDAPDGPFARHNPWLPFLAAGLNPPAAHTLHDPTATRRMRELALALALVDDAHPVTDRYAGPELAATVRPHRDSIVARVPRLRAAQQAGDARVYGQLAAVAVEHSRAMIDAYRTAAGTGPARRALDRAIAQFFGDGHSHHGE